MQIRVLKEINDLRSLLLSQADSVFAACEMPTQDPLWSLCFAETLELSAKLQIVVVEDEGRLVGFAPFAQRGHGVQYLEILGNRYLGEPVDFFFESETARKLVVEFFASQSLRIVGRRMLANSNTLKGIRENEGLVPRTTTTPQDDYPYIDLHLARTSIDELLSNHILADLRRAAKKASSIGEVSFRMSSPEPGADFDEKFKLLLDVEAAGWKGRSGTALAIDLPRQSFFRVYGERAARRGILRVALLFIDNQPAAIQYAVEIANRYWLLKIGYDQKFARCSPGNLLLYESLRHAVRAGNQSFEFLGKSDAWTDRWTSTKRNTVRIEICPTSISKIGMLADRVSRGAAQVVQKGHGPSLAQSDSHLFKRVAKNGFRKLKIKASRSYISGPNPEDALATSLFLNDLGYWVSQGYWDKAGEAPARSLSSYLQALSNLVVVPGCNTLSIKIPSLRFDDRLFDKLYRRSASLKIPIHFDSLGPETASETFEFIDKKMDQYPDSKFGCTLPGRWKRSVKDAEFAVERSLIARVVKGQWSDPESADIDVRTGFMNIVGALSGKADCVRIATHDSQLAHRAIQELQDSDTKCEIELLYGLPLAPIISLAIEYQIPVRIYVAFGHAYLPYAIDSLRRNPGLLARLVKDALRTNYKASIPIFSIPKRGQEEGEGASSD